ncbi:Coiled-coil domain containing hypothetical protein 93 [Phytophthora palmivora]|uniref:CCDC93 coiled-coil domain-containing protein n=1 Tax=Phytophthora palmivora TaxID=4796 RepID=A0A2P4XTA7_9STRA|nr:Coiled-coil domain containing hypothetical protein 93 [Phytophthora palmivora]
MKQAKEEQQALQSKRREREAKLLQRVVSVPEEKQDEIKERVRSSDKSSLDAARTQLKNHELQIQALIQEKKDLDAATKDRKARAVALDEALAAVKQEMTELEAQTPKDEAAQAHMAKLRQLVMKNETLKREKNEFRTKCRLELEALKERRKTLPSKAKKRYD